MKVLFLIIVFQIAAIEIYSQSQFGTPLIKGSVTLQIDETYEKYCGNILSEKRESKESYSSQLTGNVYIDKDEIKLIRMWKTRGAVPGGILGTKVMMNNYTETLPEGMDFFNMGNYKVPLFPISGRYEEKIFGKDPCKGWINGCDPEFQAVLDLKRNYEGTYSHHGHPGGTFRANIVGVDKCSRYLFLSFSGGGTFVENGTGETCFIYGNTAELKGDGWNQDCKWKWEDNESKYMLSVDILDQSISVSNTQKNDGSWIGSDGHYLRTSRSDEGDGEITTEQEEMMLMKIDTGAFFDYVIKRPGIQTFTATGYHIKTSGAGTTKMITTTRYSATLTLGSKPPFTITAENEEEYKNWLPGHPDYSGTVKPLGIKAKFGEGKQKDSVKFEIINGSHLPGISTNYPILPEDPPKEPIDLYFAPQDKQTDPNIRVLNDSTAVTDKLVTEAVVVVVSRDFGGHGRIRAMAMRSGEMAECPDDGKPSISVPFDLNNNLIADKWEKDMGIEGADKLEDKDNLPKGQGREGDGLTAFEEYRGFICENDVKASCDGGHTQRTGKHVRTSPLCRDVFIHDADGLFAKYVATANPAECHWHYVNSEQITLPPQEQVNLVVQANEFDLPKPGDNSAKAQTIRQNHDFAFMYMKNWTEKEFRRINTNTPPKFMVNKQFGLHLLTSPIATIDGGISIGPDNRIKQSPLHYTHLVVLPQYNVLKKRMMGIMSNLMLNTSHHTLWDKYPVDVQEKVVQTAFEAMVPHEVGHGLGIPHHTKGTLTVITSKSKEKFVITGGNVATLEIPESRGECREVSYLDGQEYLITSYPSAFIAMGVTECCMRYTVEREVDFVEMKVLKPSLKYCRKGQTFIDANGKKTEGDACFSEILIKCIE
jgi:hypothetical protein